MALLCVLPIEWNAAASTEQTTPTILNTPKLKLMNKINIGQKIKKKNKFGGINKQPSNKNIDVNFMR